MQPVTSDSAIDPSVQRLIQITDCHLGELSGDELLGLNTHQSLDDVLQLIARERTDAGVHALVCTGDIASAGGERCYHSYLAAVRRYFDVPLGWLPGNHDSARVMAELKLARAPAARLMTLGNWRLVLLDSAVPGEVYGHLAPSELDFLAQTLAQHRDHPTLVMLHHQPVPVGSAWIDQYVLRNAEALFAITDRNPQVKVISWGHVHQGFSAERNGCLLLATPSTCVQFKPGCDAFTVDTAMPGYRWFDLHPDGRFDTGVSRVTDKHYTIDYRSAGY